MSNNTDSNEQSEALKPCECKSAVELRYDRIEVGNWVQVICDSCGRRGSYGGSRWMAAKLWNQDRSRASVAAVEGDADPSESKFLATIADGLRHAIRDHGAITKELIGSAAKRVWSRIRNTKYDPFRFAARDLELEKAIGERWYLYKSAAKRAVARVADNDCLTCKHWQSDAVYAIAIELAAAAASSPLPAEPALRSGEGS